MIEWKLVTKNIKDLKPHPKNPRQLSKEAAEHLQKSLDKFGLIDKPIINSDNTIIGGHQRIAILKKMNVKKIECWEPKQLLSESDIDELNIRLNKNTGDWDWDILANQWEFTDLVKWGFDPEELIEDIAKDIGSADEESEVLEPGKDEDAVTKLGDIYELNGHRLICGDSTNLDDVQKCLNGNEPILMVTDPPYGVNYDPEWRKICEKSGFGAKVKAKGRVQNDDNANWSLAYLLFPGSISYIWHAGKFAEIVSKNLQDCDFQIINQIIWAKPSLTFGRGDYHWQHEPCWYAVKNGHNHNWQGDRKQTTLWEIKGINPAGRSNDENDKVVGHGTQKPLECMARPIRNNTAEGEGVYDPFLGSGTTLIDAEQLNRICYGIEISPAYCDIIVNRWVKFMQKNNKDYTIKKNGEKTEWLTKFQ